jgi:hypothetical protein
LKEINKESLSIFYSSRRDLTIVSYSFINTFTTKITMESFERKFECRVCGAKFKTQYELISHGRLQHTFPGASLLQDDYSSSE